MTFKTSILALSFLLGAYYSFGQQPTLPVPRNIQAAYAKGTRSEDGRPGRNYWQNTADYNIKVSFDPKTRKVAGTVTIAYRNNSPDSLRQIWFKLYPNLYQKGAARATNISPEDVNEGVRLEKLTVNNQPAQVQKMAVVGTNLPLKIKPLGPGQTAQVAVTYSYSLNKGSHTRTGQVDEGSYFIAYFFPRIAVYDDVDGWNKHPYLGSQEFYNDFCNFKVAITVPSQYVVWATGDLKNAAQVLTPKYARRLEQAEQQDGIISIIDESDLKRRDITVATAARNTWQFEARNVVDFAFATSDHYVWQSTSLAVDPRTKRRTRVDAVYNPQHKDFREVVQFARQTVAAMSYVFPKWPFPYAHETVFDGLDQMEYPMMVNDNPVEDRTETITLTDHEIFHTLFPFYMGTNETKYGWMDEGWATIGEWIISSIIDPKIVDNYGVEAYAKAAGTEEDMPIVSLSTQQTGISFFLNSYPKPGLGYLYVKDLLGDELFTKALHFYIEQWNGKHPLPYDFFNAMNTGAGHNLNWFWQRWFFDDGYPDLAITQVEQQGGQCQVTVTAIGTKPVPIDLTVTFSDNTTQKIHRTIAVWEQGNKTTTVAFAAAKPVKKVVLGSTYVADTDKSNNHYEIK